MGRRDDFRDALGPEVEDQDQRRAVADRSSPDVLDAWDDARRDALADACQEGHRRRGADAEKSADREPGDRVTDDAQLVVRVEPQWVGLDAAASAPELCTRAVARSAARSCVVRPELAADELEALLRPALLVLRVLSPQFVPEQRAERWPEPPAPKAFAQLAARRQMAEEHLYAARVP